MTLILPSRRHLTCLGLLAVLTSSIGCGASAVDAEHHSAARTVIERTRRAPQSQAAQRTATARARTFHRAEQPPRLTRVSVPTEPAPSYPTERRACYEALRRAGVRYAVVSKRDAPGVQWPIRLEGPVRGVSFVGRDPSPTFGILDCRLGVALQRWARDLYRAGVRRVEYYSMYRPFARVATSGAPSGHASGLAIDARTFTLRGGATADVLEDWQDRDRGEAPCPSRRKETRSSRLLSSVTCSAVDKQRFQIVLTPHYNHAHDNHLHLEIKPDASWMFVR